VSGGDARLPDFLNSAGRQPWRHSFPGLRLDTRHDESEPKPAFGADKVPHSDWIMMGRDYPLRVSLGTSDLGE